MNELVRLADGGTFVLRPMELADADGVRRAFAALSPTSLRLRFFSTVPPAPALVDDLATLDAGRRIVLLAFETGTGRLAGGVRAVRVPGDPGAAEVSVTVGDCVQRRGLGTELLRQMRRAPRAEGIERLTGHVLVENEAAKRMLRSAGAHLTFDEPGVLRFELPLVRQLAGAAA